MEPGSASPEFNPLRFPPCACLRCRPGADAVEGDDEGADGNDGAEGADAHGDSAQLRQLRARVAEENALRLSLRRQPS